MMSHAVGCEGIQSRTKDTKIVNDYDEGHKGLKDCNHNWCETLIGWMNDDAGEKNLKNQQMGFGIPSRQMLEGQNSAVIIEIPFWIGQNSKETWERREVVARIIQTLEGKGFLEGLKITTALLKRGRDGTVEFGWSACKYYAQGHNLKQK